MKNQELMTSQEAAQAFVDAGLSVPTFHRRVRDGEIESILPEGKQRGAMYPRRQVIEAINKRGDKYKRGVNHRKPGRVNNLKTSTFRRATVQDMPEMGELLKTFYGPKISIEKRAAWIERNPEIAYILKSEDKIVGCAFIMPLEENKIMQILESQVKPPTRPHEILLYKPNEHVSLYVRSVGVLQSVSKEQRRYWAAQLIRGLAQAIIELGSKGVFINKIYAQGDTKIGEHTLKMVGFTQIEIKTSTNRKNYMIDVETSGSVWAMNYKNALNTWRAFNEEE